MVTHIHVGPRQNLQLPCLHHPFDVYSCLAQSPQILLPIPGLHDVRGLFTPIEAILVEGAKHPALLVEAVEECADVSVRADAGAGTPQGTTVRRHLHPLSAPVGQWTSLRHCWPETSNRAPQAPDRDPKRRVFVEA